MQISIEAINFLVFLLPGFLTQRVLSSLVFRTEKEFIRQIVEALIFTWIIYAIASLFLGEPRAIHIESIENGKYVWFFDKQFFLVFFTISLGLAFVMALIMSQGYAHRVLRFLHITNRHSNANIWIDIIGHELRNKYVLITFNNGERLTGWIKHYSDTTEESQVYISTPRWIDKNGEKIETNSIGLFIVAKGTIESIEELPIQPITEDNK
ncbi:hypothetical protein AGMMS49938_06640 [Fibrobacterales bacterium]|nr:hypothetical protein AGMMS49938_06640 [Fibrobacterales bacterium]